jgi:coenzyme F420-reducing hydrogenase alpha subunit
MLTNNIYKLASEFLKSAQEIIETQKDSYQTFVENIITPKINENINKLFDPNNPINKSESERVKQTFKVDNVTELFPAGEFNISFDLVGQKIFFRLSPESKSAEQFLNTSPYFGGLAAKLCEKENITAPKNQKIPFNGMINF